MHTYMCICMYMSMYIHNTHPYASQCMFVYINSQHKHMVNNSFWVHMMCTSACIYVFTDLIAVVQG